MKVVTADEMRRIDSEAIEGYGVPASVLMGLAGRAAADAALTEFPGVKKILVICGTGNNGGDGFYTAYLLHNKNIDVDVKIFGDSGKISGPPLVYKNLCEKSGVSVDAISTGCVARSGCGLIIEAVYGTGYRGGVSPAFRNLAGEINSSGVPVLSIDIPGGLPSDGPYGDAFPVKASVTVTMGLPKLSLVTAPGMFYTGRLITADIGFPAALTGAASLKRGLIDMDYMTSINISGGSDPGAHKYRRGSILIAGGFGNMEGAAVMAAEAALNTGTGLVTILTTAGARPSIAGRVPEAMTAALPIYEVNNGPDNTAAFVEKFLSEKKYSCVIAGPGLGRGPESENFLFTLIRALKTSPHIKLILDADALFFAPKMKEQLTGFGHERLLLTPHSGEAAGLIGAVSADIDDDRINKCEYIAAEYGCSVILKGPGTVVSAAGETLINTTGSQILAAAGSGDVLAGIIAALSGRLTLMEAAAAGAFIHGTAGAIAENNGSGFLRAGDLVAGIRPALKEI